ncbi:MAG: hypothetical protein PHO34_04265, partial [Candidatus Omnitrophica bacterium]|nr:hypothetical protein [Candidatus Omnitrophota bacterium]
IIRKINEGGGTVILDLFGTPFGLGRVLDKNSSVYNLMAYKELVKGVIRELSTIRNIIFGMKYGMPLTWRISFWGKKLNTSAFTRLWRMR